MSKVLVVEDDLALNTAYQTILEASGHDVKTAFNGKEALRELKKFKPKLILLDLLMPVMGGIDFLRAYKPKEHKNVTVFLFTNMEGAPEVKEARELGVKAVVVKSMTTPQQLVQLISSVH